MGMKRFSFRYIRKSNNKSQCSVLYAFMLYRIEQEKKENVEQNISMTDKKKSSSEIAISFSFLLVTFFL